MVRKALFWSFTGNGLTMLITFLGSIVVARLLSPREMGIYAVALAIIGIVQLFAAFGVGAYVVREVELTPQKLDAAFTINLALSVALGLIIFLTGTFGAVLLSEPGVASVLQLLAITPLIGALGFRPNMMLQRGMLFRGTSIIGVLSSIINTAVTIVAALWGASYLSAAYGSIVGGLFGTTAVVLIGREHWSLRLSTFEWRKMTAFGLRIMSIGGISQASVRVSDLVLAQFLGLAALGLYSRASNLNNLIFGSIYGTATRVVFAQLSEAQRDGDRVGEVFLRGFRMIIGFMGPLLIGLAVLANPMILLLYGEQWIGAAVPLSCLLIAQFIALTFAMNWELFVIRDELKTQTRLEVMRSLFSVATKAAGSMFGLVAVAATTIVDSLFSLLLYGRHMPRLARVGQNRVFMVYGEAGLLTIAAALPSFVLMLAHGFSPRVLFYEIAIAVAIGVGLWLALLHRLEHPLMDEIRRLMAMRAQPFSGMEPGSSPTAPIP